MFQRAIYRQFLFFLTYMAKKVVNRIIHEEGQKVGEWKKEEVWEITQICICFYSHLPMNISDSWATSTFIYIIRVLARKWAAMLSPSPFSVSLIHRFSSCKHFPDYFWYTQSTVTTLVTLNDNFRNWVYFSFATKPTGTWLCSCQEAGVETKCLSCLDQQD